VGPAANDFRIPAPALDKAVPWTNIRVTKSSLSKVVSEAKRLGQKANELNRTGASPPRHSRRPLDRIAR
jgi:hypothetical protein